MIIFEKIILPIVPARDAAEISLETYYIFFPSTKPACAVRQPSPRVRAECERCTLAVHEHDLYMTPLPTLHKPHFISAQATLQHFFSHSRFLHTKALYTQKPETFAHRSFYTEKPEIRCFYIHQIFTQKSFCAEKLLHTDFFTDRNFYTQKLLHR